MRKLFAAAGIAALTLAATLAMSGTASATGDMTHNAPPMTHNSPGMTHNVYQGTAAGRAGAAVYDLAA